MARIIAHLDMDSFFAAIEERDKPRLRGLPIVVGADPEGGRGRGVVSTANYAARKYGIRSALPIATAWRLSEDARKRGLPPAAFLGVDMEKYVEVSRRVITILSAHAATVEVASVDEAFLDLSGAADAVGVARAIKQEIFEKEKLTASVGIGPNKLVAKIASDREKPNGLTVVAPGDAEKFLEPLPIRAVPGVGPKTEARLQAQGVRTVGDARRFSKEELALMFGKWGGELYEKLRGRDDSPLVTVWRAKSVGEQETFAHDTHDAAFLRERLAALAADVLTRLRADGFRSFRTVVLTVRFADFVTISRGVTLDKPVAVGTPGTGADAALVTLRFQALRLFMPFLDRRENPARKAFRLIGLRAEKLV